MAAALARARTIDGIRQRNVELALIDQIGQGLVRHLDFASIIELVGEGIRKAYEADALYIASYDAATNVISFPYEIADGERLHTAAVRPREGPDLDGHPRAPAAPARDECGITSGRCHHPR